jgi:hypothetical protein
MTTEEIENELEIVSEAIRNIMLTGQEYTTGSGASSRTFKAASLADLRVYRVDLENKLKGSEGQSGMLLGY